MNWKVVLAILTCNVVMMSASYTMLVPFLPIYLSKELHAPESTLNLWVGAVFAISFAICAIMAPIWGKIADKKGKKLMVIRSSTLIAITYLLGGLVQTPLQLLLVRAFQGFASGLWPASLALMSSYTPHNKIGMSMGIMQSANITGSIVGPLLGGLLAEYLGMRTTFFISSGTLIVITIITIIFIKEPKADTKQVEVKSEPKNQSYLSLLKSPGISSILFCCSIAQMVILLLQPIMTIYIQHLSGKQDGTLVLAGLVFSLSGIAGAIASPFWGKIGQNKGFYFTLVSSLLFAGLIISCQSLPNSIAIFACLQFFVGLGFSGIFPSSNSMIVSNTDPSQRGAAFGMLFSAQQIGGAIGPIIGGILASFINIKIIFFISGILLVLTSIFILLKLPKSMRVPIDSKTNKAHEYVQKIKGDYQKENELKQ